MATKRRRYQTGHCDDCGNTRRVTRITFWLNAMKMWVCAQCITPYRSVILRDVDD